MTLANNKHQRQLFYQYNFFKIVFVIVQVMLWSYYSILLYKQTGSIRVIAIDHLLLAIGIWIGFIISTFYLDKIGYLRSFRLMMILNALFTASFLLFMNDIYKVYIITGFLRGIFHGLYWSLEHSFKLKEIHGQNRGSFLNISFSIDQIIRIIIPVLAGSLIAYTKNFNLLFALGSMVYLIAALFPFSYNKKPRSKIRSEEITRILNFPNFKYFIVLNMFFVGFGTLFGTMISIVPYIILKDEFEVGMLGSFIGICAALLSVFERKFKVTRKIKLGYLGALLYFITSLILAFFWSIPFLIVRSFAVTLLGVLTDVVSWDLDYRMREKILGKNIQESAHELNLIIETSYFIAKSIALIIFILILSIENINVIDFVRILIGSLSVYIIICFTLQVRLAKKLLDNHHSKALLTASKAK
jgi:MFS family permease